MDLAIYFLIIIVSLINNWFVQLAYYFYARSRNPRAFANQKTLLQYWTGVVGDGVLAPLINICIYIIVVNYSEVISLRLIGTSFVVAICIDILTHYLQGYQKMTNWSMPHPYQWNFAGRWHMVSFSLQVTYFVIYIYILLHYFNMIVSVAQSLFALVSSIVLSLAFLILFWVDYR